jgi:hypothetical protein
MRDEIRQLQAALRQRDLEESEYRQANSQAIVLLQQSQGELAGNSSLGMQHFSLRFSSLFASL